MLLSSHLDVLRRDGGAVGLDERPEPTVGFPGIFRLEYDLFRAVFPPTGSASRSWAGWAWAAAPPRAGSARSAAGRTAARPTTAPT